MSDKSHINPPFCTSSEAVESMRIRNQRSGDLIRRGCTSDSTGSQEIVGSYPKVNEGEKFGVEMALAVVTLEVTLPRFHHSQAV